MKIEFNNYPGLIEINLGKCITISIWKRPALWELGFHKYKGDGWVLCLAPIEFDYHTIYEPKLDCQKKECPGDCTGCYEEFYKEDQE